MIFDKQNPNSLMCRQFRRNGRLNLSRRLFARWKDQRKRGAFVSTGALRSDCSLVRFHKRFADGQTKTQTSKLCPLALFKSIENFRQRFRLNSQAGVRDFNAQFSLGSVAGRNGNLPIAGCELHRVIDQVPKDLLESRRIRSQMDFPCAEIEGTPQMLSINFRLTNLEGILQQGMSVDDFKIKLYFPSIDAS